MGGGGVVAEIFPLNQLFILTFVTVRMMKAMQANRRILVEHRRLHNQQDTNMGIGQIRRHIGDANLAGNN